jgi:hypothetical protein
MIIEIINFKAGCMEKQKRNIGYINTLIEVTNQTKDKFELSLNEICNQLIKITKTINSIEEVTSMNEKFSSEIQKKMMNNLSELYKKINNQYCERYLLNSRAVMPYNLKP